MVGRFLLIGILLLWSGLGQAQTKVEKKAKAYSEIKSLVASEDFIFMADTALPNWGSSISLVTNDNHLHIRGKTVDAHMPFFGEGRLGTDYPGGGPIILDGEIKDYKIRFDDRKRTITIQFYVKGASERHDVILEMSGGGYAKLVITSMSRSRMVYRGRVMAYKEENEG
tara:strand:+ start:2725 stop:3231 length:507 start_codon:yes stop_codon:yes gene_type:complete